MKLVDAEKLQHQGLITHTFSLHEAKAAFEFIEKNPNEVRKVILKVGE